MSRVGTLEHVSSLSWRRALLDDLDIDTAADGQQLERRQRSSSLQQPYTRRGSRYQSDEQHDEPLLKGSSGVSQEGSRRSSHSSPLHAGQPPQSGVKGLLSSESMLADQMPAEPLPMEGQSSSMGAEHDWQSLILGSHTEAASAFEQSRSEPEQNGLMSQGTGTSQQAQVSATTHEDDLSHAPTVHHVTFAPEETGVQPAGGDSQAANEPEANASPSADDAPGMTQQEELLSHCLQGR